MDEGDVGMTAQSTPASVRRELWRDTQQQSVGSIDEADTGADPEYMGASRSPHSSFSSPQVSVDSPRISFSPLHIKDSIEVRNWRCFRTFQRWCQHLSSGGGRRAAVRARDHTEPESDGARLLHAPHPLTALVSRWPQRPPLWPRGQVSPGQGGPQVPAEVAQSGPQHAAPQPSSVFPPGEVSVPHLCLWQVRTILCLMSQVTCHMTTKHWACDFRSPVPGNYFGHYEQFFRQRLTEGDTGGQVKGVGRQDQEQDIYRRWMSDTDISSDCIENVSTRWWQKLLHFQNVSSISPFSVNISNSQDIPDAASDNVFYNQTARYPKTSSVESDQSSVQEFPLDLSMRSSMSSTSTSESISGKFLFPSRRHPMLSSSSHSYRSLSSESSSKVRLSK